MCSTIDAGDEGDFTEGHFTARSRVARIDRSWHGTWIDRMHGRNDQCLGGSNGLDGSVDASFAYFVTNGRKAFLSTRVSISAANATGAMQSEWFPIHG